MNMQVIEEKNGKMYSVSAKEIKYSGSALAGKILGLLAKKPGYPKEIASELRENEQKIYYHVRRLEQAGIIKLVGTEERVGALAK